MRELAGTGQARRAGLNRVKTSKVPAISRAAAVLRLLGRRNVPLGVQAIARELDLVPSTCLYILRALVAEELVSFDTDTKRYALEAGVLTLARHWLRANRFNEIAQPQLDRISEAFGVTMLGVNIVGLEHIIVVAISQPGRDFHLSTQIGTRFPALISATGRCIAAFGGYADAELDTRFHALRWDNPPDLQEWRMQVAETRAQGSAVDASNYISGITVVAAPVWKARGKLGHALVGLGISSALEQAGVGALQDVMLTASRSLSAQLCGEEPS